LSRCDLILGIVEEYHWHQIARFLLTLRRTRFSGHLCLFAGPGISSATQHKLKKNGAEVIPYGRRFPFIADPHPDAPKSLPEPTYIFNYRHFLYYDYLLKHGHRFRNVLLTDVKDVVFQKDPFDFPIGDQLYVAMESTSIPIGDCVFTSGWIVAGYGEDVLDELKDKELSCAGTVLGTVEAIRRYLRSMLDQIQQMRDAYDCADQAAHNLMLHRGELQPATRLYNFRGPVATVGTEANMAANDRGQLVNEDESVIAIVHQYDRHPELVRLFDRLAYPSALRRQAATMGRLGVRTGSAVRRRAGALLRKLGFVRIERQTA
jgi:hypothetical protein